MEKNMKVSKENLIQAKAALEDLTIIGDNIGEEVSIIPHRSFTELNLINGRALNFELYRSADNRISISKLFGTIGSSSERHNHKVIEIFTVWEGKMEVELCGEIHILEPTHIIRIPIDAPHKVKFLENTWMTIQSIPAIAITNEEINT